MKMIQIFLVMFHTTWICRNYILKLLSSAYFKSKVKADLTEESAKLADAIGDDSDVAICTTGFYQNILERSQPIIVPKLEKVASNEGKKMNHGNPEYKERRKGQLAIDSEIFQDYTFSCDGNGSEPKKK
uniref:Uncharacterized protein n=1 Tax=Solanum lycopersicum TaxID=4081 RepID=A0A3Q7FNJ8_SOLLC